MRKSVTVTDFVVEGRGSFPIDMLRYDECWPQGEPDATEIAIAMSNHPISGGRWQIKLRTHKPGGPTPARWESFGWKVVEVS